MKGKEVSRVQCVEPGSSGLSGCCEVKVIIDGSATDAPARGFLIRFQQFRFFERYD